ncbi:MAG: MerR family transcriptional regulator [Pseudomonadota bacterium]
MRIAEAALRSGLSVDTIRYYEKSGILPEIRKGPDGQRRFSAENIDWLTLLFWLRETGMPMKTMYRFASLYQAGDHTIPDRKQVLLAHAEHLKKRRADLDRCEEMLAYKLAIYEDREA